MSKLDSTALFLLIKSMTKAEKRHFKLTYVTDREKESPLFVQLFDAVEAAANYDEVKLLEALKNISKQQLPNLKRNLYHHILTALRQLSVKNDLQIRIRQQVDFARVLYNKGLYQQSLKILHKAKVLAKEHFETELQVQILEFEKIIEARHITRSMEDRAEMLEEESRNSVKQLARLSHLSSLALNMYGIYIKRGHVRTAEEADELRFIFHSRLDDSRLEDENGINSSVVKMSFYEKVNLYQAHAWYAYILQEFLLYYRYTRKWVDLFEEYPDKKQEDPALYLKGINNLLTAHFYNLNHKKFMISLAALESFWKTYHASFNKNTETLAFVYLYTARFNRHFMEGTFTEGLPLVTDLTKQIKVYEIQMDPYRMLVFYYKIASLYFGSGDYYSSLSYLNKIINLKIGNLKADIQCFARILHLIAHYELKNYDLLEYLLPSVHHFLEKHKEVSMIFNEIIRFLKTFDKYRLRGLREAFVSLKQRLEIISEDPYEKRFFLYLDVISWLESKIDRRPVQDIIRERFEKQKNKI